jgi:hypothetical protein
MTSDMAARDRGWCGRATRGGGRGSWSLAAEPAGSELVTRLARSWSAGKARGHAGRPGAHHLWKPLLHEVAAGSMDLTIMRWTISPRHIGITSLPRRRADRTDRKAKLIRLGATYDEGGPAGHAERPSPTISWCSRSAAGATISARPA